MTTLDWTIEPAGSSRDLDGVFEVEHASFTNPWTREMLQAEWDHRDVARIYVLRLPEIPVAGYCSLWRVFDELHINNIAIRPEHRGRGLGLALMRFVLADGARQGACRATLEVRRSNTVAQRLYERLGFVLAGTRRDYYIVPVEDALILWHTDLSQYVGSP
jgi:[ribosomal protein S18]-alanine N-acetyltransferase